MTNEISGMRRRTDPRADHARLLRPSRPISARRRQLPTNDPTPRNRIRRTILAGNGVPPEI